MNFKDNGLGGITNGGFQRRLPSRHTVLGSGEVTHFSREDGHNEIDIPESFSIPTTCSKHPV